MQNEPNLPHHPTTPQKCKTNPIYTRRPPGYAKRTQFHPGATDPPTKFCKTNPISARDFCKTNPIPGLPDEILTTICYLLFLTKRTQYTVPRCFFDFRLSTFASLAGNSPRRPIHRPAPPLRLSPLYFLLSRGQQPAHPISTRTNTVLQDKMGPQSPSLIIY